MLTLHVFILENTWRKGQYHGCWCPGDLCRQVISSNDIENVDQHIPFFLEDFHYLSVKNWYKMSIYLCFLQ